MDGLKQLKIVKNIYIIMSLLFCVLGIFLIAKPESSIRMLCIMMGVMLMSIDAKKFGLVLWWQILVVALATGVIGILVFIRPFEAATVMMMLVGFSILLEGILNLWVAVLTIKIIKDRL